MTKRLLVAALSLTLIAPLALARTQGGADDDGGTPMTELTWESAEFHPAILVRGATIWTQGPDGILEDADLLVEDGKIAAVDRDLEVPADVLVIDGSGRHVTPGIIDAHSHTAAQSINEGTQSVTAEVRIQDVLNPHDPSIYKQLAGGTTTAQILHGSANAIGGQSAIVKWKYRVPEALEMVIDDATPTIKFALGENPKRSNIPSLPGMEGRYPATRMGVEQVIREAFLAGRDYIREWEEYEALSEAERARTVPPRRDLELEAIAEILEGERLIHSHSYRQDEILMLMRLMEEYGVTVQAFQHVLEGYKVGWEMAAHGAGGSTFSDWWAYKLEAYDAIPYNGAVMHDQGVVVSFNSDSDELARRLNLEAAKAVKYGRLSPEEALDFVTLNPARQLEIDHRVGSLEPGKDGDFVVWNGPPLSVYSRVERTFIEGREVFNRELDLEMRQAVQDRRAELIAEITGEDGDEGEGNGDGGESAEDEAGTGSPPEDGEAEPTSEAAQMIQRQGEEETAGTPETAEAVEAGPWVNPPAPLRDYHADPFAQEGTTAIVGATVHPASGPAIEEGVVVFSGGVITAVGGPGTAIPEGAEVVDAAGKHLWPGMIATDTILGLYEIGSVAGSLDFEEIGDVNPNVRAEVAVDPESEIIPVTRANGITHALTIPRGGVFTGTSALIRTDGWTWEGLTAAAPAFSHVDWPDWRASGFFFFGSPPSEEELKKRRERAFETIEETLEAARAYARAKAAEAEGGPAHDDDPVLESLVPVIRGEVPLMLHTNDVRAVRNAVEWAEERDLRIVLLDSGDAWRAADLLAEHDVPVIVSSILDMPMRDDEPYDSGYARAAKLWEAGVEFAIGGSSGGPNAANVRNLPDHAGMAAAFGLPPEEAVRSVTLYPAEILGLGDVLGSIEEGKSASLVLTDGDLLEITTHVEGVWIDGRERDLGTKHTRLYDKYRNRPRPPYLEGDDS